MRLFLPLLLCCTAASFGLVAYGQDETQPARPMAADLQPPPGPQSRASGDEGAESPFVIDKSIFSSSGVGLINAPPATVPANGAHSYKEQSMVAARWLVARGTLERALPDSRGAPTDDESLIAEQTAARELLLNPDAEELWAAASARLLLRDSAFIDSDGKHLVNLLMSAGPEKWPLVSNLVMGRIHDCLPHLLLSVDAKADGSQPAVGLLARAIQHEPALVGQIRVISELQTDPDPSVQAGGIAALDLLMFGENGIKQPDDIVQAWGMVAIAGGRSTSRAAVRALVRRGAYGLREEDLAWTESLWSIAMGDESERVVAAKTLGRHIGNRLALGRLRYSLWDQSPNVLCDVIAAIKKGGPSAATASTDLSTFVHDHSMTNNPMMLRAVTLAASTLVAQGPAAKEVAGEAASWLPEPTRKDFAVAILSAIGPDASASLLPLYVQWSGDVEARRAAIGTLASLEMAGPSTTTMLCIALQSDRDPDVCIMAARGLMWAASDLPVVRGTLEAAMTDPDEALRIAAATSLAEVGPDESLKVETLIAALRERGTAERYAMTRILGSMGERAAPAIPTLVAMIDNVHPSLRVGAAQALVKMDSKGKRVGRAIVAAVMHKDRVTLGILLPFIKIEATKSLNDQLREIASKDPEPTIRNAASQAARDLAKP